jgi:hypothetical protein
LGLLPGVKAKASAFWAGKFTAESALKCFQNKGGWNAGGHPNQWIELDMTGDAKDRNDKTRYTVTGVEIKLDQSPNGQTVHQIEVASNPSYGWQTAHVFRGLTENG